MKVESFVDPYLGQPWSDLGVRVLSSGAQVAVTLGYPAATLGPSLAQGLRQHLQTDALDLDLKFSPPAGRGFGQVKHIVAVASGKGGVGKSTTAVNLALALSHEGAKVGLLDADIYGPSQGMLLGIPASKRPEVRDEKFFEPVKAHGLKTMSMSYLVTDKTPMVWRGPMASGALQQLLKQTLWEDLDYLVVDMPPGTGDIQLTLSQQVPVSGAVIVTTPQDIALLDAQKGIEMFRKVDVPCLGILENMSQHHCSNCGHISHPFGDGGGARVAEQFETKLLGQLPLALEIRELSDAGRPLLVDQPDSPIAQSYLDAARHLAAELWRQSLSGASAGPTISLSDD